MFNPFVFMEFQDHFRLCPVFENPLILLCPYYKILIGTMWNCEPLKIFILCFTVFPGKAERSFTVQDLDRDINLLIIEIQFPSGESVSLFEFLCFEKPHPILNLRAEKNVFLLTYFSHISFIFFQTFLILPVFLPECTISVHPLHSTFICRGRKNGRKR